MPLTSGSRLGVFTITAPIGVGGMGEVYRDGRDGGDCAGDVAVAIGFIGG